MAETLVPKFSFKKEQNFRRNASATSKYCDVVIRLEGGDKRCEEKRRRCADSLVVMVSVYYNYLFSWSFNTKNESIQRISSSFRKTVPRSTFFPISASDRSDPEVIQCFIKCFGSCFYLLTNAELCILLYVYWDVPLKNSVLSYPHSVSQSYIFHCFTTQILGGEVDTQLILVYKSLPSDLQRNKLRFPTKHQILDNKLQIQVSSTIYEVPDTNYFKLRRLEPLLAVEIVHHQLDNSFALYVTTDYVTLELTLFISKMLD